MLCDLIKNGFPVPPGFVVTSDACKDYFSQETPEITEEVWNQISEHVKKLEEQTGKKYGGENPLFLSIRPSPPVAMPKILETASLIGNTQESIAVLASKSEDPKAVWTAYIDGIKNYGTTVSNIPAEKFDEAVNTVKGEKEELDVEDFSTLSTNFKEIIQTETENPYPEDPLNQLKDALKKCFDSWKSEKVTEFCTEHEIDENSYPAFLIQATILGNRKTNTATTRDPISGQGGEVNFEGMEDYPQASIDRLQQLLHDLDLHYKESEKIDFQIDGDDVWICKCEVTKKPADAELRFLLNFVKDGILPKADILNKIDINELANSKVKVSDEDLEAAKDKIFIKAHSGAPGFSTAQIALTAERAAELAEGEQEYIYVCKVATKDDYQTLSQSKGVITIDGSENSYAAAIAKYIGVPAVIGCKGVEIDLEEMVLNLGDNQLREGDPVTLDGEHGVVYTGSLPLQKSSLSEQPEISQIVEWGDELRIEKRKNGGKALMIYATTDNPDDAARARTNGAEGVGMCNTDSLLLGERTDMLQRLIIGHDEEEDRDATRQELEDQMNGEIGALFESMNGYPVVLRLSDPQIKEYLPDVLELIDDLTVARFKKAKGEEIEEEELHEKEVTLDTVKKFHDFNPLVGIRGIRLSLQIPGLLRAQIRAVVESVLATADKDLEAMPYIALPFVTCAAEVDAVKPILEQAIEKISKEHESETEIHPQFKLAAMIEVPRAALITDQLAKRCDALIFNTDILTQQAYGIDVAEAEPTFLPQYALMDIFNGSPINELDVDGIANLLEIGIKKAKEANPDVVVGVAGKHCSSPEAVQLFHKLGFDFVSCSVDSLSVVRLAAAKAVIADEA
ncbi:Pyruvate, phosphate dikinase [Tritrichomonas foetus]|uniref:pyruvate, phosphate dikinase n=1 Tax=Tritrichomonas foetus TaxID=1144522 RepID=A0A1J4L0N9_9EUKA|nr:Pyruvate, phosphate dikinase [Tritrichomonas foetus]|eukprot:OHT15516.1 Pyruvate, phosphate dikinase [Tritrichomonas foetus]